LATSNKAIPVPTRTLPAPVNEVID
jgi:hypothetical protein